MARPVRAGPVKAVATLAAVAALAVAGGAGGAVRSSRGPMPGSAPAAADPTLPSEPAAPVQPDDRPAGGAVTLAFAGDVHFEGGLADLLERRPGAILAGVASVLAEADLAVVNLETAITERGTAEDKEHTFRAPASALDALAAGGIDVASMANNHGVDYGADGLADSLAASDASGSVAVVGIGRNAAQAYGPHVATVGGRRVAVIAATQVLDHRLAPSWTATDTQPGVASAKDVERLAEAVRGARATADTVVVFLHWGVERETCPSADQRDLARRLVAEGADVVVGGHAHRVQGAGRLGDALVGYGLGNFVFSTRPGAGTVSGVLLVTMDGRDVVDYRWVPVVVDGGVPRLLEGPAAEAALGDWERARDCTGLDP